MIAAAIVLAAGASTRMGRPKPLLPWGNSTLLAWELKELLHSCVGDIVVVTGAHADEVRGSLGDCARYCTFNPLWALGRAGSLACGAHTLLHYGQTPLEAIMVQNVDQPTRHDIIDRLFEEIHSSGAEAVQPSYRGRPVTRL